MCVEVVKSIALKPTRSITGAMVSVLAVSTPSAAHRHWLPSRREVSTIWMSATVHLQPAREVARIHATGLELGIAQHIRMEREIGRDARDARGSDGFAQLRQRGRTIRRVRDDLRHERVIERRYACAGHD